MLEDYIRQYEEALKKGDEKTKRRIEKELASLGMDLMTLRILVRERKKGAVV